MGRFTVQSLDGQWYVGAPDAAQRIDGDGQWLDAWLLANGVANRSALDFGGDALLEQRFVNTFADTPGSDDPEIDRSKGRHRRTG